MKKCGVCLLILLSSLCFSTASRAQGFWEMMFGGGQHRIESHENNGHAAAHLRSQISPRGHHFASRHRHWTLVAHRNHGKNPAVARAMVKRDEAARSAGTTKLNYAETPGATAAPNEKCCSEAQEAIAKILREDQTLRSGDAYMTNDGLRVFVGERESDPQFVPVDKAIRIGKELKARLVEVEKPLTEGIIRATTLKALGDSVDASHSNSMQKPTKSVKERLIKASNGKTIRLVGGYAG